MNIIYKRFLTFLLLCIPSRILLIYISKKINIEYLPYLGLIAIIIATGFIYNYIFKKEKGSTFNQDAWWNYLRPIHSLLYYIFAYLAINKNSNSYIPLVIDVIIGFLSFIINNYSEYK
tara:strand:+ start:234 stop:587 length:354 start_codon:yes stop_codon:yes gene_type:complete